MHLQLAMKFSVYRSLTSIESNEEGNAGRPGPVRNESMEQLNTELGMASEKLDKYSNKLDKTHNEIHQLHEKLDKIYRTYGAGKSVTIIHPGTNAANREKSYS